MTATHKNRVKMTVTSVANDGGAGLGALTLNAASSGYQSFATAYGANATVDILITEGATWEVARECTYTHSGTTLSRGTTEASSSAGSKVAFTSAAVVSVILSAAKGNSLETLMGAFGLDEIAVTGAVTATIGRMHHCTGTSANYTVTLPAASGNTGKLIGFRMGSAAALTKLVTLDGNVSETIDGALTRVMWAMETAILLCDGSNWHKVAGKSLAMQCQLAKTSDQAIGTATITDVTVERTDVDNTGQMADLANDRVLIVRPGKYLIMGHVMWNSAVGAVIRIIGQLTNSNTATAITAHEMSAYTAGCNPSCQPYALADLLTTSTIKLQAYTSEASPDVYGVASGDTTQILLIEQLSW